MAGKVNIESTIQTQLVLWIKQTYPEVRIKYNKNEDAGSVIKAMQNKRMGRAEAGFPDLTLEVDKYNWTWILELELKKKKGVLSAVQKAWWAKFTPTKNKAGCVAYGFLEAQSAVTSWLLSVSLQK